MLIFLYQAKYFDDQRPTCNLEDFGIVWQFTGNFLWMNSQHVARWSGQVARTQHVTQVFFSNCYEPLDTSRLPNTSRAGLDRSHAGSVYNFTQFLSKSLFPIALRQMMIKWREGGAL